jgi:acyl-CoA reductase-like NAD-dependent aldehyde dehydrogenase
VSELGAVEVASAGAPEDAIDCREPATRAWLGRVRVDTPAEIAEVVRRARVAQASWRRTSFAVRRRVLTRVLTHLLDHKDQLCELVVRVCGKTRENAMLGEIWPVADRLRWAIARGERYLAPERVSPGLLVHKRAVIEYRPRGVIGAIGPWNYPLQNILNPVIPALMAGNACVVKASEWVAWASRRVERIVHDALAAEGVSTDLVRVVNGRAEAGRALIQAGVDLVVFIGSVGNGRRVLEACAPRLTPAILELGGKDPMIVCDDADLEQAVHAALNGTFIHCGQNCVASERILVHAGIHDAFEARVAAMAASLRQGPPLGAAVVDVGAMVTPLQREVVESLIADAVRRGARVLAGGRAALVDTGDYVAPTVLAGVTPDMPIMQEETFGPVMLLCRVSGDDEAVAIANGTRFGLGASVLSRDPRRARSIAARLEAGMAAINDYGGMTYMAPDLPFGGVKDSGFGRLGGRDGLRALTHPTAILDERLPLRRPNRLFPVGARDYAIARGAIDLLYGPGVRRKLAALRDLARGVR